MKLDLEDIFKKYGLKITDEEIEDTFTSLNKEEWGQAEFLDDLYHIAFHSDLTNKQKLTSLQLLILKEKEFKDDDS